MRRALPRLSWAPSAAASPANATPATVAPTQTTSLGVTIPRRWPRRPIHAWFSSVYSATAQRVNATKVWPGDSVIRKAFLTSCWRMPVRLLGRSAAMTARNSTSTWLLFVRLSSASSGRRAKASRSRVYSPGSRSRKAFRTATRNTSA